MSLETSRATQYSPADPRRLDQREPLQRWPEQARARTVANAASRVDGESGDESTCGARFASVLPLIFETTGHHRKATGIDEPEI